MTAVGSGWRDGRCRPTAGLSGFGVSATVGGVVMSLRMYSFLDVMIDGLNYVRSVALKSASCNPSWNLTAVGAGRSASAVHTASRRWLSFLR
jgi:hypothetical protein